MKIKNIEDLTLEECQDYLDANPNGEFAIEVVQRMKYLRQLKDRKVQQDKASWINEFNTEFNRYYATQRYEDAFATCLKYIKNIDDRTIVLEKANSVISKLKKSIQLPSSVTISYDWLIDQLAHKGYDKMKYDGNSLKWQKSRILIKQKSKTSEIISECRFNLLTRIICLPILIFATYFLWGFTTFIIGGELLYIICLGGGYEDYFMSEVFYLMLIIGITFALVFLFWWLRTYIKMHKEPRLLLRRIANIIIDNLAKQ